MTGERSIFARVARFAVRRPWVVLALIAALSIGGAALALRLSTDAGTDTLVDRDDETFQATERFKEKFGDDAVVVLAEGDLRELVLTENLGHLLGLEGCLSGNLPEEGLADLPAVCREIAELNPSRVVFGPATFLNQSRRPDRAGAERPDRLRPAGGAGRGQEGARAGGRAGALRERAGRRRRQASQAVQQRFQQGLLQIATDYGITKVPQIDDPDFVSKVVFDSSQPAGTPKARFSYLFPNSSSALISLAAAPRPRASRERNRAIELIQARGRRSRVRA